MHSLLRRVVMSWIPPAAAIAAVVMTVPVPHAQQAAPPQTATIRVSPADGQPPDSLRLGQPFNVRADIPEDWNPGGTVTVALRDGNGDTHQVTLTRTGSARGVATFATTSPESIGGARGGTAGLFGFKTAGTIDVFDGLTNGGTVTASLQGFRGPQASNVSASVPVYDDDVQQGIARNNASLDRMEGILTAQETALTQLPTAGMPPDVKAEYDATLADVRMRLAWLREARVVLAKHDTPRGDLEIGNTYLSLITRQDFGALDPRFVKSDATFVLMQRLETIVPDSMVSVATGITLANYKIVADLSGAGAAYRAGQLVTDPVLEWLGHNPGFARDEFGRPITTGQQVWAVFEVGANVAGIFAGPKLIDWLAGRGMMRGATPRPRAAGATPDVTPPVGGTPRPPAGGGRGVTPGPAGANTSGTLRDPLAGATEPGALRQPTIGGAVDDTVRVPRRAAGPNAAAEAAEIEGLVRQAQAAGVPQTDIRNAMARPTNADAIRQLRAEIAQANKIQADYEHAIRMDNIEGLTEARNAAKAAGVPDNRIVTILTQPRLNETERIRLLAHETLVRQGYRLNVTSAEFTQVNGIYVRARTGNLTQADIEYLHSAVRNDPNFFDNLSRTGRLDTDNGFDAVLPPNAARELRDIYDGLTPRPAGDPTRLPPVAPPLVTTGSNPPTQQQAPGSPQQQPPSGNASASAQSAESRLTPADQKRLDEVRRLLGASTDPEDRKLLAELNELFAGPNPVLAVMRLADAENLLDLDMYRYEDPASALDTQARTATPETAATPASTPPPVPPVRPLPDGKFIEEGHRLNPSNEYDAAVIAQLEAAGYGSTTSLGWTVIEHVDGTFEYINFEAGAVRVRFGNGGKVGVTGQDLRPGSVARDAMRPHITDAERAALQQQIEGLLEIVRANQTPPRVQRGACGYALWCAEQERKKKEAEAAAAQPPQRYMCGYQMACEAERKRKEAEAAATGGSTPNAPAGTGTMQSGDGAPVQTSQADRDDAVQVMIIEVGAIEAPPVPQSGRVARRPASITPSSLWNAATQLFRRPQTRASLGAHALDRDPRLARVINIGAQQPVPTSRVRTVLTNLGSSTGESFELQVLNEGQQTARLDGGILVVEPLKSAVKQKAQKEMTKIASRHPLTSRVNGYCLEFLRQPPAMGTLFRVASPALQQKFEPMRRIVETARRLQQAGRLNPDSDPAEYFHSIKQWALWAKEQNFSLDTFRKAFVEHAKKNLTSAGRQWTPQIAETIAGLVPGRWQDVTTVLAAAETAAANGGGL